MGKPRLLQAIVVEGRYDKNTLSQIIDAPIFVTNGFGIFKDPDTLALLRAVAEKRGLIILTDADGAGFVIRNYLKGAIPPELVKQAYIPDIYGKERRKSAPGREGKLGVEGMDPETLIAALRNAGATFLEEEAATGADNTWAIGNEDGIGTGDARPYEREITKADLYELGLTGRSDSKAKRLALQKALGLPEHLSTNALLEALNCITTRDALFLRSAFASEERADVEKR